MSSNAEDNSQDLSIESTQDYSSQIRRHRRYHNLEPFEDNGKLRNLRQVLNVVFILGAIAGVTVWLKGNQETGTYILIGASVFKFVELTLRIMKL